jgi:alkanesulfonate monooxygenase SsuD/methylene tetrahydromethanopterin reductase-like flavin-dependent oxidoreductase (luciferase family)
MQNLLEEIALADQVGLDIFGIGEHHRAEFLDEAPEVILSAAASRTNNIGLSSAVTVLSAADPVHDRRSGMTIRGATARRWNHATGRSQPTTSVVPSRRSRWNDVSAV